MIGIFNRVRKRSLSQKKVRKYLAYAIGEVILLVLGIFIALQVNNWNEERKQKNRFWFGVHEMYSEVMAIRFMGDALQDRITYQLIRIDSILDHPDDIKPRRLPAYLVLIDEFGSEFRDSKRKMEFLEDQVLGEEANNLAKMLTNVARMGEVEWFFSRVNLDGMMKKYLQDWDIPLHNFETGMPYNEFVSIRDSFKYREDQLERVVKLIKDPSFIADLMSIREIKQGFLKSYIDPQNNSAESMLAYFKESDPKTDYSLNQMEIIGSGLPNGQWTEGIGMRRVFPENDQIWEIDQEILGGYVKFRSGNDWVLDWGMSENDSEKLVFKGSNFIVDKGFYHVEIDISKNKVVFKKID